MDYGLGHQVILFDPRLNTPQADVIGPPSEEVWWLGMTLLPPKSRFSVRVDPKKDTVADLFGMVSAYCAVMAIAGVRTCDALHIMAHGLPGYVQIGKDGLTTQNANVLVKLKDRFRYIVFHSCLVAKPPPNAEPFMAVNTVSGSAFARKAASITGAGIVAARQVQIYSVTKNALDARTGFIHWGNWEGPVDLYQKDLPVQTFNGVLDPTFDLQKLIFPASKR